MQKITTHLWFDTEAEEAVQFYVSIFRDSKIVSVWRYGEQGAKVAGRPAGSVMNVAFQLEGQDFLALNGGPVFKFTPAISLLVNCETQEEIDRLWEKLTDGGEEQPCGWLTDKFGLSWQITPSLSEWLQDDDPQRSERVMKAFFQMKKIDIAALKRAYEG